MNSYRLARASVVAIAKSHDKFAQKSSYMSGIRQT
jgi:hypothetical protein